jgi:hypothetical protein
MPVACGIGGKTKPALSSSFTQVASPRSMAVGRERTLAPRRKGFSGDFRGGTGGVAGAGGAGGLGDALGVRGGSGRGNGRTTIGLGVCLPSISSYSRNIMRSKMVRTHEAEIIICGKKPI